MSETTGVSLWQNAPIMRFDTTEERLLEIEALKTLKIKSVNDNGGADSVHAARMEVKNERIAVDKVVKRLKKYVKGRIEEAVGEANKIKNRLAPVEEALLAEENRYKDERARIKREAEEAAEAALQARVDALQGYGVCPNLLVVRSMSDGEFGAALGLAKAEHEKAEEAKQIKAAQEKLEADAARKRVNERLAEAKKKREKEEEKNREEKKRLAAEDRRLAKERAAFAAEKKAHEDAKAAKQKGIDDAAKAEKEAEERAEREAEEKAEAEQREAEAAARAEALKPDKEKMLSFVEDIKNALAFVPRPLVTDSVAQATTENFIDAQFNSIAAYKMFVEELA